MDIRIVVSSREKNNRKREGKSMRWKSGHTVEVGGRTPMREEEKNE